MGAAPPTPRSALVGAPSAPRRASRGALVRALSGARLKVLGGEVDQAAHGAARRAWSGAVWAPTERSRGLGAQPRLSMTISNAALCSVAIVMASVAATAQQRAPSPDGRASTQVLGHYEGARDPIYIDGRWIEISYGRPLMRGRDLWGTDATYGRWLNRGAPVWRAGADVSTYLMTQASLVINETRVEPGGYSMFIDLKPDDWTLIVSNWQPQPQFDRSDDTRLWGSYGYTPDKDVVRVKMTVTTLPYSVDELTWSFLDMSDAGGKIAIMWDTMMAVVPFTVVDDG